MSPNRSEFLKTACSADFAPCFRAGFSQNYPHVSTRKDPFQGRQRTPLLEHCGKPTHRLGPCGAAPCTWARSTTARRRRGAKPSRCSTRAMRTRRNLPCSPTTWMRLCWTATWCRSGLAICSPVRRVSLRCARHLCFRLGKTGNEKEVARTTELSYFGSL